MRLLISGSRQATGAMLIMAERAVLRAKELGWSIVVGDASGVDAAVIRACEQHGVECQVYGIQERPRTETELTYTQVQAPDHWHLHPYLYRDQVMVQQADIAYCIWNEHSRGTRWTYNCALRLGKVAHLFGGPT